MHGMCMFLCVCFLLSALKGQVLAKSMSITTAKRLSELLNDRSYVQDSSVSTHYVVSNKPEGAEKTFRAIPVSRYFMPLAMRLAGVAAQPLKRSDKTCSGCFWLRFTFFWGFLSRHPSRISFRLSFINLLLPETLFSSFLRFRY